MHTPNQSQHDTDEHPVADPRATGQHRATGLHPSQPRRGRRNWRMACLAVAGSLFAFGVIALVVLAIILPPVYRNLEPLQQEIWCNRAENVGANFVCDWKPTPPFETYPTLERNTQEGDDDISPEDLLLTPFDFATDTPDGNGADGTPVSGESTVQPPPGAPNHTPTPSQSPLPTGLPTLAPTATNLPPATATPPPPPPAAQLELSRIRSESQRWNNCGPTTLTMGLSYFGYSYDQGPAASYLKPNVEDKNVSPWQMVDYVNQTATNMVETKAIYRAGGNLTLLKRLIANDFPVIIEKGYEVSNLGWMGHYLLLVGYDDAQEIFYTYDSYLGTNGGRGRQETYDYVDRYWRHFNRTFIVLYRPEREQFLGQLLGDYADPLAAAEIALAQAQADANADPNDKWAWVNMTSSLVMLEQHHEAASAFDRALQLQLPYRLLWYQFAPFEAYYHIGRYADMRNLADNVDRSSGYYVEEAWYYRGLAYAAEGNARQAITELERVLRFNRNFDPANEALAAVQNGSYTPPTAYNG